MTRHSNLFQTILTRAQTGRCGPVALVLGLVSAAGFQPLGIWPLALLAMGLFALLLPLTQSWKQAAWLGWLFGLGHFTLGNAWIATAFTHQANMPVILGWGAVPLGAAYVAIYPALAALAAWLLTRGHGRGHGGAAFALAFAGCWIVAEWLRSWALLAYGWNPFGVILLGPMDRPGLAALAPWLGTYALSGLAVLVSVGLAQLLFARRWLAAGLASILLAVGMYFPAGEGEEGTLAVTLVQPDIEQENLHNRLLYDSHSARLAQLSVPENEAETRLVLWPESGMADYLEDGYPQRYYNATTALGSPEYARAHIARTIGDGGLLLTGGRRLQFENGRLTGAYNSVLAVNDQAELSDIYSKAHLVPFGEYVPLRAVLEPLGIDRLVPGAFDFLSGPGPQTLDLGDHGRAGVQICYEIVFSGEVTDRANRPDYIFNPSNDGWFGAFGPPQHFAQARLRAVEEGLPVLRSTTNGISGIIDARGVVRRTVPSGQMGRIDAYIPPAAPPTLFALMGNVLPLLWAVFLLGLALIAMRKPER